MINRRKIEEKIALYHGRIKMASDLSEIALAAELAIILGCRAEVDVPMGLGRCDLLSKDWLIEAKKEGCHSEKSALGQLLLYKFALKFRGQLGIALIGYSGRPTPGILQFCQENNIVIFYYNINIRRWTLFYYPRFISQ